MESILVIILSRNIIRAEQGAKMQDKIGSYQIRAQ